jgi:hypothetical protein
MKILWKNHPYDKSKNGTADHVTRTFAEVAVGYGQADYAPKPNYGTPEWLQERWEQSARAVPTPGEVNVCVDGVQWGVQPAIAGYAWSKVMVVKKVGSETFFYATPPPDAPLPIVQQYWDLVGRVEDPETIRVRECQLAAAQQAQDIADKQAERAVRFGRTATTKSA